jgi:predicted ribosomally synthesized peptide with SipW-like signal peptide
MKKTASKKMLLASAAAVGLSAILFAGTTLAWFTDSTSSAVSTLESGNLDLDFEVYNASTGKWEAVTPAVDEANPGTDVLSLGSLNETGDWEPGHVETAYVRIKNSGTLSMKYELNLAASANTFTNVNKATTDLTSYVFYGVHTSKTEITPYTDRSAALADLDTKGKSFAGSDPVFSSDLLKAGETDYIAITVYMPETVGNEANWDGTGDQPKIEFSLHASAGQTPDETDSFDKNYDKSATLDKKSLLLASGYQAIDNGNLALNTWKNGPVYLEDDAALAQGWIQADCVAELNGNTINPTGVGPTVTGGGQDITVSLTNGTYEYVNEVDGVEAQSGTLYIKPNAGKSVDATFENMNFISSVADEWGQAYNGLVTLIKYAPNGSSTASFNFKGCTFDQALLEFANSRGEGQLDLTFEDCTFNYTGTVMGDAENTIIQIGSDYKGTVTFKNCTFNINAIDSVYIFESNDSSNITYTLENVTINDANYKGSTSAIVSVQKKNGIPQSTINSNKYNEYDSTTDPQVTYTGTVH